MSEGREFGVRQSTGRGASLCWFGLILLASTGCSPASYSVNSTRAVRALEHAKRSQAEEHARYELTLAEAYLAKAREESGEAAYQDAVRFARAAKENAEKAVEKARQARQGAAQ